LQQSDRSFDHFVGAQQERFHLSRPLHDPSERFFSLCHVGLSAVDRDPSQFEALK
jgi:hypothetical protein